jgi:AcrR family transcriptional regulator
MDADSDDSPQRRLLAAAKALFAERGYEQTSTAILARTAGTSESQLVRHFGGKRGLLAAVFDHGWAVLNQRIGKKLHPGNDPVTEIETVLSIVIDSFQRDRELAYLFLFEGRRVREAGHLELSEGYQAFVEFLRKLIKAAQKAGVIAPRLSAAALASALIGAAEGMIRDEFIARMAGKPQPFTRAQVTKVFRRLLRSMADDDQA